MSEREALAEALWRHKMARPEGDPVTWCVCLTWSKGRGDLDTDERAYNDHVAEALARLLADAEQRGAAMVAAAVEAVCDEVRRQLRMARTDEENDRG